MNKKKEINRNPHQHKIDLMKRLIDLYQQVENVRPASSKLIVEDHMHKLENELINKIRGDRYERYEKE